MQTINDIRREMGNPRHGEVASTPRSLNHFFRGTAAWKAAAALVFILAVVLICIGIFALVFPISIAGVAVLVLAVILYARGKWPPKNV